MSQRLGLESLERETAELVFDDFVPDETVVEVIAGRAGEAIVLSDRRLYLVRRLYGTDLGLYGWPRSAVVGIRLGGIRGSGMVHLEVLASNLPGALTQRHAMTVQGPHVAGTVARVAAQIAEDRGLHHHDAEAATAIDRAITGREHIIARVPGLRHLGLVLTDRYLHALVADRLRGNRANGQSDRSLRRWSLWAIERVEVRAFGTSVGIDVRPAGLADQQGERFAISVADSDQRAAAAVAVRMIADFIATRIQEGGPEGGVTIDLEEATDDWMHQVVVRTYTSDDLGRARRISETIVLGRHGYVPATESHVDGKVKVGALVMTGAAGAAIRASRNSGAIRHAGLTTVTFAQRPASAPPAQRDLAGEIERLARLRDAGVINDEEFAAGKAKILEPG